MEWGQACRFARIAGTVVFGVTLLASAPAVAQDKSGQAKPRQLNLEGRTWKGDFDRMLERRMIRVLVPYSRTLYYSDKGRERGVTADLVRDLERYINRK